MDSRKLRIEILGAMAVSKDKIGAACDACIERVEQWLVNLSDSPSSGRRRNLTQRLNNPGGLRFVKQDGAVAGERGFCLWGTPEEGWIGLVRQVRLDQGRGLTLREFIYKYAPPSENDSALYLKNMCLWLNAKPDTLLQAVDPFIVSVCVARQEGYFSV